MLFLFILPTFLFANNSFNSNDCTNSIRIQEAKAAIKYHSDFLKADILKRNGKPIIHHISHSYPNPHPNWLQRVNDKTLLSWITLPGSHESCTRVGGHQIVCQGISIIDQLNIGIRFFDLHIGHVSDVFLLYHGSAYQQLTFQNDILDVCIHYLSHYPSETIIFLINEEIPPSFCTQTFEDTLLSYISKNKPDKFYLNETIPTLEEIRGKIVIFRRFETKYHPLGNEIKWKPDSTFTSSTTVVARVQDESTVTTLFDRAKKLLAINKLFMEAQIRTDIFMLYLNFISGSGKDCDPMNLDQYIKPAVQTYLKEYYTDSYCGIILMDFVEQNTDEIIPAIIERNTDFPPI